MEMSAAYLRQTVAHLQQAGYEVTESADTPLRAQQPVFERVRFRCRTAPETDFILELLTYPDGREAYYLEIVRIGVLRCTSFPLDSWKFRPASVEFKFYVHPETGLGLSFILDLAQPA